MPAVFLEDLAVTFERTFWCLLAQHGTGSEEIFDELGAVDAADASEPFKNLFIRARRRGTGEVQRVGDDTRAKANGRAFVRCGFLHAVHDANDGRSAADRLIDETNRLLGAQIATKTMMIDDFDDFRFVCTCNGLGELVVINEHEFHTWQINEIRL